MVKKKEVHNVSERAISFALLFLSILSAIILLFNLNSPFRPYMYIMFILSTFLLIYVWFACPHISDNTKKIELGILLLSAVFFFGAFYVSWWSSFVVLTNEFSPIYYSYTCPNFNLENESFDFTVLNSDLTKGISVRLKFIGDNICIRNLGGCSSKRWVYQNPIIILPGKNFTFNLELSKSLDGEGSFLIDVHNLFSWRIARADCKYS